jgi:hypothetical protein
LWIDPEELAGGDNLQEALTAALRKQLYRGGYVIVFWSSRSSESLWVRDEIQLALAEDPGSDTRVLFALLDASPIPASLAAFQPVQLFGDAERSATNRLDDLVVRLYWLIYKNSKAGAGLKIPSGPESDPTDQQREPGC